MEKKNIHFICVADKEYEEAHFFIHQNLILW